MTPLQTILVLLSQVAQTKDLDLEHDISYNNGGSYVGGTAMGDPAFGLWANWGGNSCD